MVKLCKAEEWNESAREDEGEEHEAAQLHMVATQTRKRSNFCIVLINLYQSLHGNASHCKWFFIDVSNKKFHTNEATHRHFESDHWR